MQLENLGDGTQSGTSCCQCFDSQAHGGESLQYTHTHGDEHPDLLLDLHLQVPDQVRWQERQGKVDKGWVDCSDYRIISQVPVFIDHGLYVWLTSGKKSILGVKRRIPAPSFHLGPPVLCRWSALRPDEDGTQTEKYVHGDQEKPDDVRHQSGAETQEGDSEWCLAQQGGHYWQGAWDVSCESEGGEDCSWEVVDVLALAEGDVDGDERDVDGLDSLGLLDGSFSFLLFFVDCKSWRLTKAAIKM